MKLLSIIDRIFAPWKKDRDGDAPVQSNPRIRKEIARRRLAAQQIEYAMRIAAIREETLLQTSPNAAEILERAYSSVSRRIDLLPQAMIPDTFFLQSSGWVEAIKLKNDDPGILETIGQIRHSLVLGDGREVVISRKPIKTAGQNNFQLIHELQNSDETKVLPNEIPLELFPLYTTDIPPNTDIHIAAGSLLADILSTHGFFVAGILTAPIHVPGENLLRPLLAAQSITIWAIGDHASNTFLNLVAERLYQLGVSNLRMISREDFLKNTAIQDLVERPELVRELNEGADDYSYETRSVEKVAIPFDAEPGLTTRLVLDEALRPPVPALIPAPRRAAANENAGLHELKTVLEQIVKSRKLTAEQKKSLNRWLAGND